MFFFGFFGNYSYQKHYVHIFSTIYLFIQNKINPFYSPSFLLATVAALCHNASNNTCYNGCYGYCYLEEGSWLMGMRIRWYKGV